MDISNLGLSLINTGRFFVDEYVSRNESLADIMRRTGFCEEKGSGTDKALINSELYKLPPMRFSVSENRTTVTLFSYRPLSEINKQERLAACYQDACIKSNACLIANYFACIITVLEEQKKKTPKLTF